jgi:hypothetical protein
MDNAGEIIDGERKTVILKEIEDGILSSVNVKEMLTENEKNDVISEINTFFIQSIPISNIKVKLNENQRDNTLGEINNFINNKQVGGAIEIEDVKPRQLNSNINFSGLMPIIPVNAKPMYPVITDYIFQSQIERATRKIIGNDELPSIPEDEEFKTYFSPILFKDNKRNIGEKFVENLKDLISLDWMDKNFKQLGGVECPKKIKDFVEDIKSYIISNENKVTESNSKIKDNIPNELYPENIISHFFRQYLHSMIGKPVQYPDSNLKTPIKYNFKKGNIVGYLDSDGVYKWGVVKEDVSEGYSFTGGKVKIEHILKIIRSIDRPNDNNNDVDEINKYYCKVPKDFDKTPLSTIISRDGNSKILDSYNVDLL